MSSVMVDRREFPHHTHAQIAGYLRDALAIVNEAELDGDLRTAAFLKVVDLLAAKQIVNTAAQLGVRGAGVIPAH